ncbi:MAG: oxoglutarate dehydrogenase (succinyl-transferring), E1 component [Candidatus Xenolissoclinum pacificiensis L6]|uniref:2-oxoglutarate dehydrogenase E1 component n=1 Tax=Candidatus Xenolissoclinum pacificiensis L6 TaxID=1401685 RepID=W2V0T2_9RICK|nr:MAG: oxoglutarate dehydrogenase (succinyl-transferring), E1 component [Candidatus Xenolissoclinum pacificiensis L6]
MISRENLGILESLYNQYIQDPSSVDQSWRKYFSALLNEDSDNTLEEQVSVQNSQKSDVIASDIIQKYRDKGFLYTNLSPLGSHSKTHDFLSLSDNQNVDLEKYNQQGITNIQQLGLFLDDIYCNDVGYETAHISSVQEREWLYSAIESQSHVLTDEKKKNIYTILAKSTQLEEFIHSKFRSNRFSLEGIESLSVVMEELIEQYAKCGAQHIFTAMPHRGRVNFLVNIFGEPIELLMSQFQGKSFFHEKHNLYGDVKYHMGYTNNRIINGHSIDLSLLFNPSHLEAVVPVLIGKVRAEQDMLGGKYDKIIPICLHGDAAFSGQGVVYEYMVMSQLRHYNIGGMIHIIANNQIGFTTDTIDARKNQYPSFIGKALELPIIHLNSRAFEKIPAIVKLAIEYRRTFGKSVIIDLHGFRKYGHNEQDEPKFTQPKMYDTLSKLAKSQDIYKNHLVRKEGFNENDLISIQSDFRKSFEQGFEQANTYQVDDSSIMHGHWKDFILNHDPELDKSLTTGVKFTDLQKLASTIFSLPSTSNPLPKLLSLYDNRLKNVQEDLGIDWGTAEALSFASIIDDGISIRMMGQDVCRGTFSHRHGVIFNQEDESSSYIPFNQISNAKLYIGNSNLSEYAALGVEYGYSEHNPNHLVIWEAQFGDFVNGAQIIIDQFLVSGETKWGRSSGLVLLLPHGMEGLGPEHSSGRIERFLQMGAQNNIRVLNCSTPANYFHALRRQVSGNYRKPAIIFSPKSLLRSPEAISFSSEFEKSFQNIIVTSLAQNKKDVKKVLMCTGKVFYTIKAHLEKKEKQNAVILRLEQLFPLCVRDICEIINQYSADVEVIWCQEEAENMGSWYFIYRHLTGAGVDISYVGREASSSPATGSLDRHNKQSDNLLKNLDAMIR